MRVLVACEFSGIVRNAFAARGHDAWSCDIEPTEKPGNHFQCDVLALLETLDAWDLIIAHPPCTYLAGSGARWWKQRESEQLQALIFVGALMQAPTPRFALENPYGAISTWIRKPDQIIHPWQFGHGEQKITHLWLRGVPKLQPTNIVEGREQKVWKHTGWCAPEERRRNRSRTYPGIAAAMAEQWG